MEPLSKLKILGTQFKPFLLPAQIVSRTEQYRGLLHSLSRLGLAGLILFPSAFWIRWAPVAALVLGYASHLSGDAATESGIRQLYASKTRFHLL